MLSRRCWTHRFNQSGDSHNLPPPPTRDSTCCSSQFAASASVATRNILSGPKSTVGTWDCVAARRQSPTSNAPRGRRGCLTRAAGSGKFTLALQSMQRIFLFHFCLPSARLSGPNMPNTTSPQCQSESRFICTQPQHIQRGIYIYIQDICMYIDVP